MLIPGPNVALIVANSVVHGPRYGMLTVAGTSAAMILQLGLVALGMTQFLGHARVRGSSSCAGSASPISSISASRSGGRRWSI